MWSMWAEKYTLRPNDRCRVAHTKTVVAHEVAAITVVPQRLKT